MSVFEKYRNQLIADQGIYLSVPCSQDDSWGYFVETYVHEEADAGYVEALDAFMANRLSSRLYERNLRFAPNDSGERESYFSDLRDAVIEDNQVLEEDKDIRKWDGSRIVLLNDDKPEFGVYQMKPSELVFEVMGFSVMPEKILSVWEGIASRIQLSSKRTEVVAENIRSELEEMDSSSDEEGEQDHFGGNDEPIPFHFTYGLSKKDEVLIMRLFYQPLIDAYADFRFIIAGPDSLYLGPYGTQAGDFWPILAGQRHDGRWEFSYFSARN